jgi:serine/threonine protein kinase
MNEPLSTCNPRRIDQCLADALSDEERAAFEAHLESCSACRQALESSAAAPHDWQSVRTFLSSEADDQRTGEYERAEAGENESVESVLTALAPTDDPRMLGRLGAYEIAGVVGRGGMGVVLKALDPALNRFVAIKVLAPQLATSGAARQRFAREARAAASVVHENVVAIHAVADSGPLPYFVMPYLRGASLQKRLDAHGPLGISEILRVAMQIASGLAAAHAQGLVHRDIKPANILLEDGVERLKITDFGLARAADDASLTRTGVIAGTPQFMSPEQARGELVDHRSDLFSLGSVMYAMCTGRPPFRAETSYGTLQRICEGQPRDIRDSNPEIPEWLVAFIWRLHAKDPAERFQTAAEVAQLLEQCVANLRQPDAVPLPDAVSQLAVQRFSEPPMRRAAWLSSRTPRHVRRAASILSQLPLGATIFGLASAAALIVGLVGLYRRALPQPAVPVGAQAAAPVHISGTTTTYSMRVQSFAAPAHKEMPLPDWDDDIARQVVDLQAEVERLEHRVAELEAGPEPQNPPLPPGENRGEGAASPESKENSPTKQESEP